MFEFGDDYRWCSDCEANVRADAYVCRYCRTPIGSRLLKNKKSRNVARLFDQTSLWTPGWDLTLALLPEPFRQRILTADAESPPAPHLGFERGSRGADPEQTRLEIRNSDKCSPLPPTVEALGLLMDFLLAIHHTKEDLAAICANPRLQLLEITVADVVAEYDRRVREINGGTTCTHCAEFILSDEACRFCGGTPGHRPEPVDIVDRMQMYNLDHDFLRRVLIWEAAHRKMSKPSDTAFDDSLLVTHHITESEVQAEVLAQREDPSRLPKSRWRERTEKLGLKLDGSWGNPEGMPLHDVRNLGSTLDHNKLHNEAIAVYNHGLTHWRHIPNFPEYEYILKHGLSSVYMSMGDYGNYQETSREALSELPDELREMMSDSEKRLAKMFTSDLPEIDPDMDPIERFEKAQKKYEETLAKSEETYSQMEAMLPGIADMMKGIHESLYNTTMDASRITAEANSASMKGEYELAIQKFEQAIAMCDESSPLGGMNKTSLLCQMGETFDKWHKPEEAEKCFLDAIELGTELMEISLTGYDIVQATQRYATFLQNRERLDEAKAKFEEAIARTQNSIEQQRKKNRSKQPADAVQLLPVKLSYAQLLKAMNLQDELQIVEAEIEILKQQEKVWEQKRKNNRRAFLEGLPSED